MTVMALMNTGRLDEAVALLGAELQACPADRQRRTFLFELLCFAGALDRAERQLTVLGRQGDEPETRLGVGLYHGLLAAERSRARLFADGVRPKFMFEVPPTVELHLQVLDEVRRGRFAEARALFDRTEGLRASPSGTAGGTAFEEFRDVDDRLAPILEIFTPAGYFWVPWEQVQFLEVAPPRYLRDLLWAPAKLATWDGQPAEVFVPNVYPGSASHPEGLVRLGRKTDWRSLGEGIVQGSGQKILLVGDDARTLPELGTVQFSLPKFEPATSGEGRRLRSARGD